jgi:hypothetical protein
VQQEETVTTIKEGMKTMNGNNTTSTNDNAAKVSIKNTHQ